MIIATALMYRGLQGAHGDTVRPGPVGRVGQPLPDVHDAFHQRPPFVCAQGVTQRSSSCSSPSKISARSTVRIVAVMISAW